MEMISLQLLSKALAVVLLVLVFSCTESNNSNPKNISKTLPQLNFSKAVLYSIDSSIYKALDTTWAFPDGKQAYWFAFNGGTFVDSTGRTYHDRYNKYQLSASQISQLKENFIDRFCDQRTGSCLKMYRDVLVLQDSLNR